MRCKLLRFTRSVPEKLSGLPLNHEAEFTIELYPGNFLVSITPYCMELKELKVQLQELLENVFI